MTGTPPQSTEAKDPFTTTTTTASDEIMFVTLSDLISFESPLIITESHTSDRDYRQKQLVEYDNLKDSIEVMLDGRVQSHHQHQERGSSFVTIPSLISDPNPTLTLITTHKQVPTFSKEEPKGYVHINPTLTTASEQISAFLLEEFKHHTNIDIDNNNRNNVNLISTVEKSRSKDSQDLATALDILFAVTTGRGAWLQSSDKGNNDNDNSNITLDRQQLEVAQQQRHYQQRRQQELTDRPSRLETTTTAVADKGLKAPKWPVSRHRHGRGQSKDSLIELASCATYSPVTMAMAATASRDPCPIANPRIWSALESLPVKILYRIFDCLWIREMYPLVQVSKRLLRVCRSYPLWRSICTALKLGRPNGQKLTAHMALICKKPFHICHLCETVDNEGKVMPFVGLFSRLCGTCKDCHRYEHKVLMSRLRSRNRVISRMPFGCNDLPDMW